MPRPSPRPRAILASALALGTAAALAGCTFGPPRPSASARAAAPGVAVEVTVPKAPKELRQPRVRVDSVRLVSPSKTRPEIVVASRQDPGAAPEIAVWQPARSGGFQRSSFRQGITGSVTETFAVGSEDVTIIGGSLWKDGVVRPVLWTSRDRLDWSPLEAPRSFGRGSRIVAAALADGRLVVVAVDRRDRARAAIRVDREWRTVRLPRMRDGVRLNPTDLAASGNRLVLLARPAAVGSSGGTRAFASATVSGADWTPGAALSDGIASVAGLVATRDAFVVTGSRYDADAVQRPVSWTSKTGEQWSVDALDAPRESRSAWVDTVDVRLGAPTVGPDGGVTAVMSNENSAYSTVWHRGAGRWTELGQPDANEASGETGVAVRVDDDQTDVLLGTDGHARSGMLAPDWTAGTVFARRDEPALPVSAVGLDSREPAAILTATRSVFDVGEDGYWSLSTPSVVSYADSSGIETREAIPTVAKGLQSPVYASSEGTIAVLGSRFSGSGPTVAAGYLSQGDDWTPMTGFPADGLSLPTTVRRLDGTWFAALDTRQDLGPYGDDHAAIYASADGVSWTRTPGSLGDDAKASSVVDLCEGPGGVVAAFGWVQTDTATYSPRGWIRVNGAWSELDLGEVGDSTGYFTSCAGSGDDLVVAGFLDGRPTVTRIDDDQRLRVAFRGGTQDAIGDVREVDGGFAASGARGNADGTRPVLWLSPDGRRWNSVPVPSRTAGSTESIAPLGSGILVSMSPTVGDPIILVKGSASLIRRATAAGS